MLTDKNSSPVGTIVGVGKYYVLHNYALCDIILLFNFAIVMVMVLIMLMVAATVVIIKYPKMRRQPTLQRCLYIL